MMKFITPRRLWFIAGGAVLVLTLLYIGVSWYVASQIVERNQRELTVAAAEVSANYEDVTFTTSDGISLKGWLFSGSTDRLVVLVAGFGNTRVNDDYNGVGLARDLLGAGYGVLMYDARGVSQSEGKYITQADHEWKDARAAVDYAVEVKEYQADNIAIIGASMGATTIADNISQFKDVGAIVLDSAAKDFEPIVAWVLREENGVPNFIHPGAFFMAKLVYGVDIPSVRPIDGIADDPDRAVLFLHAVHDALIPVADGRDLVAKVGPPSKLVEFPEGAHIQTYIKNPELYRQEVFNFLNNQLSD